MAEASSKGTVDASGLSGNDLVRHHPGVIFNASTVLLARPRPRKPVLRLTKRNLSLLILGVSPSISSQRPTPVITMPMAALF